MEVDGVGESVAHHLKLMQAVASRFARDAVTAQLDLAGQVLDDGWAGSEPVG